MNRRVTIRVSGRHHRELRSLLFPGDGKEAVAIALCGRHRTEDTEVLCVHQVHPVPKHEYTERDPARVSWGTDWLIPHLLEAERRNWAVVKIHSHPTGFRGFSQADDDSDRRLFPSVHGWTPDGSVHASAVMLPDGDVLARGVLDDGTFVPVDRVLIAGDTVRVLDSDRTETGVPAWSSRHAQALGSATTTLLGRLRIGVVGCSGTGSFVVELLGRLGVGRLVLVDPENVEEVNLNRIIWAHRSDVGRPKVEVARGHLARMDLGTSVTAVHRDLAHPEVVAELAACDLLFGCVDSHDGRRLVNRVSTFYVIPYIDTGVRLDADGAGGLDHISGAVHYLQPGGSSLLSRGVIDNETAAAEALRRADPSEYAAQNDEGYLRGVAESRPAIVSVNGMFASMAVNELLARLHGFREDDQAHAEQRFVLHDPYYVCEDGGPACPTLERHVGRGDVAPLLDMPELTTRGHGA